MAVLSAGGASAHLPPASLSRRRVLPLVLGAAALFAGVVAVAPRLSDPTGAEAPDYAVVPTGLRVRVLAIDGLERRMAEHLVAGGEMPALGALLAAGRARAAHGRAGARARHRVDDDRHRARPRGARDPGRRTRAGSRACARR